LFEEPAETATEDSNVTCTINPSEKKKKSNLNVVFKIPPLNSKMQSLQHAQDHTIVFTHFIEKRRKKNQQEYAHIIACSLYGSKRVKLHCDSKNAASTNIKRFWLTFSSAFHIPFCGGV
jgi:hypothetical protein